MNESARPKAQLLKKLTAATVCEDSGGVNPDMPQPIKAARDLFDLFGVAFKFRTGSNDKGEWCQFIGQFEAVTPDGMIYAAPRCHVPQPFEDMLFSQLQAAQQSDSKASVQFAVRVSIVPPQKGKPSMVGYEYRVKPLVETEAENPLALLREAAYKNTPRLEAPKRAA